MPHRNNRKRRPEIYPWGSSARSTRERRTRYAWHDAWQIRAGSTASAPLDGASHLAYDGIVPVWRPCHVLKVGFSSDEWVPDCDISHNHEPDPPAVCCHLQHCFGCWLVMRRTTEFRDDRTCFGRGHGWVRVEPVARHRYRCSPAEFLLLPAYLFVSTSQDSAV